MVSLQGQKCETPRPLNFAEPVTSACRRAVRISVIITAYNRKNYLLNAVRSAADQTLSKDLYEVVVVKSFEDRHIDDYIRRLGFKNVIYDTPRYGERLAAGIEESSGDVLAFLEDDDEFEREKLGEVYRRFSLYKRASYLHDTRKIIYYNRPVDASIADPLIRSIVEFHEKIVPRSDVLLDPFDKSASGIILKYPGILVTVSLMSVRRECIEGRLALLKNVRISVESFIPTFAGECGLLYYTRERLTRYRIHDDNLSVPFTREGLIRALMNLMKAIEDHELVLANSSPGNRVRDFVRRSQLEAKLTLYYAPDDIKALLHYKQNIIEALADAMELCIVGPRSIRGCVSSLLSTLYNGLPVKPLSRQTLKKALRRST